METTTRRQEAEDKSFTEETQKVLYGAGGLCLAGGGVYYVTHLEFVPLTKRYRFMMYSRDDVCQLLKQEMGTGPDSALDLKALRRYYQPITVL